MVQWFPGDALQCCNLLFVYPLNPNSPVMWLIFQISQSTLWQDTERCVLCAGKTALAIVIVKNVFQARKSKGKERTMPQSSMHFWNYHKIPLNRVVLLMLLATAPQSCRNIEFLLRLTLVVSLATLWWITICMIVDCQCKMISLQRNLHFLPFSFIMSLDTGQVQAYWQKYKIFCFTFIIAAARFSIQ